MITGWENRGEGGAMWVHRVVSPSSSVVRSLILGSDLRRSTAGSLFVLLKQIYSVRCQTKPKSYLYFCPFRQKPLMSCRQRWEIVSSSIRISFGEFALDCWIAAVCERHTKAGHQRGNAFARDNNNDLFHILLVLCVRRDFFRAFCAATMGGHTQNWRFNVVFWILYKKKYYLNISE